MKMLAVSVLVAAMMALTTGEHHVVKRATQCQCDWFLYRGRCFRYIPSAVSWSAAETSCVSLGANLASVHNRDEELWIQRLAGNNPAWIGGSDAQQEGVWFWSDGTTLNYVNWCRGEPNNTGGRQNCLQINWTAKKCWDDENCSIRKGYVCVKK